MPAGAGRASVGVAYCVVVHSSVVWFTRVRLCVPV